MFNFLQKVLAKIAKSIANMKNRESKTYTDIRVHGD